MPDVQEVAPVPIWGHPRCSCGAALGDPVKAHNGGVDCVINEQEPEASRWHRLTRREHLRLLAPIHEFAVLLAWTPIRDRLRCPACTAVGTWKPHGSLMSRIVYGDLKVRRWLCKWCGYYTNAEGRVVAYPDREVEAPAWTLPKPGVNRQPTPAEAFQAAMGKTWPWRG